MDKNSPNAGSGTGSNTSGPGQQADPDHSLPPTSFSEQAKQTQANSPNNLNLSETQPTGDVSEEAGMGRGNAI